jgi:hypothetical protein
MEFEIKRKLNKAGSRIVIQTDFWFPIPAPVTQTRTDERNKV